jgi:hypothetical protein
MRAVCTASHGPLLCPPPLRYYYPNYGSAVDERNRSFPGNPAEKVCCLRACSCARCQATAASGGPADPLPAPPRSSREPSARPAPIPFQFHSNSFHSNSIPFQGPARPDALPAQDGYVYVQCWNDTASIRVHIIDICPCWCELAHMIECFDLHCWSLHAWHAHL